ncbi:MAG: hypothetical protein M1610_01245 [Nitrospirae bacterium]|nr:hypothetical protein [Nitrospirota bacterium]MDA8338033.1 hypothetical protein [Nitrospiraceae bacterium]
MKRFKGGIIEGTVKNMETGEISNVRHYLFSTDLEFFTIAKIEHVESFKLPDNSFQISVDCSGLDSIGQVFKLDLDFTPESVEAKDRLLNDLKVDSVFIVKGTYTITQNAIPHIILHDPYYEPVYPQSFEEEIREVFRVNGKERIL